MAPRLIAETMPELFPQVGRLPGRHVSTAIHRVMKSLYPNRFGDDPIDMVRANLGNAVERVIIQGLAASDPDRYVIPGQLEYNGVLGTPDLLDVIDEAIVEIKLTWASAARAEDIEDEWFWRYWTQGKSYAKMLDWRKVRLIIVFINGGWEGGKPGMPCALAWEDDCSEEDINDAWDLVETYA